jgi:hypothetical protein
MMISELKSGDWLTHENEKETIVIINITYDNITYKIDYIWANHEHLKSKTAFYIKNISVGSCWTVNGPGI